MSLSYIPLFVVTYFFQWLKPNDIISPSIVDLLDMLPEQKAAFESMAFSNAFNEKGIGKEDSLWNIWCLTPQLFEKEAKDKAFQEAKHKQEAEHMPLQKAEQDVERESDSGDDLNKNSENLLVILIPKEIVVAQWTLSCTAQDLAINTSFRSIVQHTPSHILEHGVPNVRVQLQTYEGSAKRRVIA